MKKSRRSTEPSCSGYTSRIKLGWLLLLLFMSLIIYAYFCYSSTFSSLSRVGRRPHELARSAVPDRIGVDASTRNEDATSTTYTELNSDLVDSEQPKQHSDGEADHDKRVAVPYVKKKTVLTNSSTTETSLKEEHQTQTKKRDEVTESRHSVVKLQKHFATPYTVVKEIQSEPSHGFTDSPKVVAATNLHHTEVKEEPLPFDDNNEIANSIEEFTDQDSTNVNMTESDYRLETDSGASNASTGEFGVVFSDNEPSNDEFGVAEAVKDVELLGEAEGNSIEDQEWWPESLNDTSVVDGMQPASSPTGTPVHVEDHENEIELHSSLPSSTSAAINSHDKMLASLELIANHSNPHCSLSTHFTSWKEETVSQVGIPIKRDCKKLRANNKTEVQKVKSQIGQWKKNKPWEQFALKYKNMSYEEIKHEFENSFYVSETEKDFPIAYIFVVYTNAGQVLRLLKTIYRPQNLYCIHPDTKKGKTFASFFKTITKCLDNVFVASKPIRVYYGHHSIMDSQLLCMQDLVKYPVTRWKYAINLCGREVPVMTNREIVESLRKLKGYTALNLKNLTPNFWTSRFRYKFRLNHKGYIAPTHERQSKPPQGIKVYKSMNFIAASRAFVQFILSDPLSRKFQKYLSTVYAPEEHYYSSLYALPQAKGAMPPKGLLRHFEMPVVDNFIWINTKWQVKNVHYYCPGRRVVHGICILTTPDLGRIEKNAIRPKQPIFFFNKYFLEWDPTPADCMEERLVQTNMAEYWHDCVV